MEMGVEVRRHRTTGPPYCPIPAAPVPLNHVTDGPLGCAVPQLQAAALRGVPTSNNEQKKKFHFCAPSSAALTFKGVCGTLLRGLAEALALRGKVIFLSLP